MDLEARAVTLSSGDVLTADVIIGADGVNGLARQFLVEEEAPPPKVNMYRSYSLCFSPLLPNLSLHLSSTTIPRELIMEDKELAYLYSSRHVRFVICSGDAVGY